jgi:hypothetical protein
MKCLRIYADPDGESHFADVEIPLNPVELFAGQPPLRISAQYRANHWKFDRGCHARENNDRPARDDESRYYGGNPPGRVIFFCHGPRLVNAPFRRRITLGSARLMSGG